MGIGGDILKGIVKEATRDITKEFDEKRSEAIKERKRNEAALDANKSAKERGLSAEEAEEEIDLAVKVAEDEMKKRQEKANKFFTRFFITITVIILALTKI